jgi:cellulose synthase/poly-beta-1,6-N-acetylglucosamine synthase-like glycosyltransferase
MTWGGVGSALVGWYAAFVLLFLFAINSYYLVLTLLGFWRTVRLVREVQRPDSRRILRSPLTPPISVLAPAFNEEANVEENVRSLLMLDYPLFEVILINDGSSDRTLEVLIARFDLRLAQRRANHRPPHCWSRAAMAADFQATMR